MKDIYLVFYHGLIEDAFVPLFAFDARYKAEDYIRKCIAEGSKSKQFKVKSITMWADYPNL